MQFCIDKRAWGVTWVFIGAAFLVARSEAAQRLKEHLPPGAAAGAAMGRVPATKRLHLAVGLPLRNAAELTSLLRDLYDPANPAFHKYLTSEQFTARFGPSEQDYRAVAEFFTAHGFTVTATHPNRVLLDVDASVGDVEKALHVTMREYRHPREGRTFFAPDSEPWIDMDTPILHISGLDNYLVPRPASLHPEPIGRDQGPKPNGGSGPSGTYMGVDFRAAYAPGVALNGAGQYVGLLQFDGYYPNDVSVYLSRAGLTNVPLINVLLDGFSGTPGQGNTEVALDIEVCIAMAPGLSGILVYEGLDGNDILNRMATDNLAKQLSASWTFPTDATTQTIFQQMAAQGQSYFNASGDNGAYAGVVATPADSPYITSVGGTTLTTRGPGQAWVSETTWNWASTGSGSLATGGGVSTVWPIPAWQQGIDMTANQGSTTMRNIPDVAMIADKVFAIGNNGQQVSVGGTSIGAPLWAAFMALVNQQAAFNNQPSVGFLNPAVYALGSSASYSAVFHDVTTGNNTNGSSPTLFYARTGYDLCTGWGTPTGRSLINALAPPANAPVIVAGASRLVLETCSPANGVVDPGEVVVVSFALQNVGGVDTTNLTATLLSTNGINPASGPQSYGALPGAGAAVTRQFTFSANGACGSTITPVLQLQDGPVSLGTVSFSMPMGTPVSTFSQNFDGVVPPVFPSGWTLQRTAGATNWVTSSVLRDTVPNAAFAYEPTNAGAAELISPPISITSPSAQLVFRNYYNTEVFPTNAALAYDGGVLEISLGGAAFSDILAAGGSFVSGGYTRTIQTTENPLDGRQVWAGVSGGFLTTAVSLPAAAAGQSIRLKWRFGFDNGNAFGAGGWYVDSVAIQEGYACCNASTNADLALTQSLFPNPGRVGQNLAYTFTVSSLGPGPAVNVTFTNTLPTNVTLVSASPGYTINGRIMTWNFGLMPLGSSTNLLLLVAPAGEGWVTNNAVVSTVSFDPELANNSVVSATPILAPPSIATPPASQVAVAGSDVTFSVNALGTPPLAYQWRFNSSDLPGQTASSLLLTNVTATNMGNYVVVVTNLAGAAASGSASLRVLVSPLLSLTGLAATPTNVSVSLSSVQGLNYTLEYKNSLNDSVWTPIPGVVVGNGSTIILQDTNGTSGTSRFYRVNTQ